MADEEEKLTVEASTMGASTTDLELPKGLGGQMDGERPPMSKMEEAKQLFASLQEKYGHYFSHMKPWREFAMLSKPNNDMQARLRANLVYFQINYLMVALATVVVFIISHLMSVITICVLSLVWMAFLKKNEDPNWEVQVAGVPLGKSQRSVVLGAISVIAMLCVAAERVFSGFFTASVLCIIHGVLHAIPEGADAAAAPVPSV